MRFRTAAVTALAAGLLVPAAAHGQGPVYPEPKDPGKVAPRPTGKHKTYAVCRKGCRFKKIQAAVSAARPGDTIRVKNGTYREAVNVSGPKKSYLRFVGNPAHPEKVVLAGGGKRQNGFNVQGADQVTVRGFKARDYVANGFFFVNVVGYTAANLIAQHDGVYGIYAFNSKGGTMRDSEAFYHNDAGFYIGQTPQQVKPIRSKVVNVKSWGNPIGWSGTNMRYVTITGSRFYNNAVGIVPNATEDEKFPPAEDNVITGNQVFWNNFDFPKGAPFKPRTSGVVPLVPIGTGILLEGGRGNLVAGNQVYGNYAIGIALIEGILITKTTAARALAGNVVRDNAFGLAGTDLNGRELGYDGNGSGNCFAGNTGVSVTIPADRSTLASCPFSAANAFSTEAQNQMLGMIGENAVPLWIKHPHAPKPGFTPLEIYKP